MKIAFYINNIKHGGAERVITTIANELSKENEILFFTNTFSTNEYSLNASIKRFVLDEDGSKLKLTKNIARLKKLIKYKKELSPVVMVSFMRECNVRNILSSVFVRTKSIVSVRSDPSKEYKGIIGKIISNILFLLSNGCVFQTEDQKNWFNKIIRKKSTIISNPIKRDFFIEKKEVVKHRIVSVGRLVKEKRHDLTIAAFKMVSQKFIDSELFIYGEGPEKYNLQDSINRIGLTNKVHLCGLVDNVEKGLRHADCFVLASDYEGMPNALLEAQSMGVACVSTDCPCGGPRKIIGANENGILVPMNSSKELANAISYIFSDVDYKNSIENKARLSSKQYEAACIAKQWMNYIESILR